MGLVGEGGFPISRHRLSRTDDAAEHLCERRGVAPADFDLENLDRGPLCSRHSDDVFCGRDEAGLRPLGGAEQPVDFAGAKRMMIGKRPSIDKLGAEYPQGRKEFVRAADPGKGQQARAGEPLPGDRPQSRVQDRESPADPDRIRQRGCASAPSSTTASARASPRARLSRNGPAGITRPLPKP